MKILCVSNVQNNGYASLPKKLQDAESVVFEESDDGKIYVSKNGK